MLPDWLGGKRALGDGRKEDLVKSDEREFQMQTVGRRQAELAGVLPF